MPELINICLLYPNAQNLPHPTQCIDILFGVLPSWFGKPRNAMLLNRETGEENTLTWLRNTGLSMEDIETALLKDRSSAIKIGAAPTGKTPILRQVPIGGHTIEYRVVPFNPGEYGIGTYYLL